MPLTWIQHLSFGGLTEPSQEWVLQAKKMEKVFAKFNGMKFGGRKNLVKKLTSIVIKIYGEIPEAVVKAFILQRTYIGKKLNKERVGTEIGNKRKREVDGDTDARNTFNETNYYQLAHLGPIKEHTVLTLDPQSGKVLGKWGADLFYMPHGLTVDRHDNLWVTDVALHQAFKI
ncbi:hypothetical protein NQ314_012978 [Rhamnusium bicolor]|uniref:Peptidylamidoglycolate lyase n=1 Tax=Rhamnusium bicolor TaxID=1586634 RepID=A0AAV8X869_9CUCU|nr:hypothetical protein NQ314_012978 [Rhamnusium bicolor]